MSGMVLVYEFDSLKLSFIIRLFLKFKWCTQKYFGAPNFCKLGVPVHLIPKMNFEPCLGWVRWAEIQVTLLEKDCYFLHALQHGRVCILHLDSSENFSTVWYCSDFLTDSLMCIVLAVIGEFLTVKDCTFVFRFAENMVRRKHVR